MRKLVVALALGLLLAECATEQSDGPDSTPTLTPLPLRCVPADQAMRDAATTLLGDDDEIYRAFTVEFVPGEVVIAFNYPAGQYLGKIEAYVARTGSVDTSGWTRVFVADHVEERYLWDDTDLSGEYLTRAQDATLKAVSCTKGG